MTKNTKTKINIKRIIKDGKVNPTKAINDILEFVDFGKMEIKIYGILIDKKMTMKEITNNLGISERMARNYIKKMLKFGMIKRFVVKKKRLMYVYSSQPIKNVWKKLKINIRKSMKEIDKELLLII